MRVKRRSRRCGAVWSEATHAECDCKWLSPPQRAPHALKAEGFHRRPAEDWAGTASLTSPVSRQLPQRSTEEWRREERRGAKSCREEHRGFLEVFKKITSWDYTCWMANTDVLIFLIQGDAPLSRRRPVSLVNTVLHFGSGILRCFINTLRSHSVVGCVSWLIHLQIYTMWTFAQKKSDRSKIHAHLYLKIPLCK